MTPPEGLLLLDKPEGPTSHDLVAAARRALGQPRIGHTGTLDPSASGLLLLVLGRATRLARFLPSGPKAYEGTVRLGVTTATDDLAGEILERAGGPPPPAFRVLEAAAALRGDLLQVPPSVSARKVGGRRLYALARRGLPAVAEPAPVHVARFDLQPGEDPWTWRFRAEVSAGTYIRSLARDLGRALGCGGAVASLRRTAIGDLRVEAASARPHPGGVIPLDRLPLALPGIVLGTEEEARRFAAGVILPWEDGPPGTVRVAAPGGRLLGVGSVEADRLRPRVVLPPCPA